MNYTSSTWLTWENFKLRTILSSSLSLWQLFQSLFLKWWGWMFSPAPFFEVIKKHRHNWATTPCQTLGINYTGAHPCPSEMCPPFPRAGSLTPTAAITTYILRCPNLFSSHPDLFPDLQISMTIHWTWPYARPQSPRTQHMQISQYPGANPSPWRAFWVSLTASPWFLSH